MDNLDNRVTIKDIALKTNLSYGTIHRALNGKKGVGDQVRAEVIKVANELGYVPNHVASSLKRKPLRIVVSFPSPEGENKYFYSDVWQGYRNCMKEFVDYNISVIEVPYHKKNSESKERDLLEILDEYKGDINGLITQGHIDETGENAIMKYHEAGIPIAFACDDIDKIHSLCCVEADHNLTGMVAAELITSQIPHGSSILIGTSENPVPSHFQTLKGFESFIKKENLEYEIIKVYGYEKNNETFNRTKDLLNNNKDIKAIYSVNARDTVSMCKALIESSAPKNMAFVGSDIFKESVDFLKQGYIKNIMYKNPKGQAFRATKYMLDFLFKNIKPEKEMIYVDTLVVFRSNIHLYDQN